jgi:hypothetical protein
LFSSVIVPPVTFEVCTFIFRLRFAGGEVCFHRPRILGLEELDEAVTGFFGGHKTMPGGAPPDATVEVHIQYSGVARPSPALEVTGEFGLG